MPRFLQCAGLAAVALATPAIASEAISRHDALVAIHAFEANSEASLLGSKPDAQVDEALAASSAKIIRFALESDRVVVDLGPDAVPWCDLRKGMAGPPVSGLRGLLLAAYIAGEVKGQLLGSGQDPNPYPGWAAMLRVYRMAVMREGAAIPEINALLSRQMDGTLVAYAADAKARSIEALRKKYGDDRSASQSKSDLKGLAVQP